MRPQKCRPSISHGAFCGTPLFDKERERERDEWILSLLYCGEIMSSRYGGLSRIGLALEFRLTIRLVEMNYECDILIQT